MSLFRAAAAMMLVVACAGCGGGGGRMTASSYRMRAARSYPAPGPPNDPWGPYVVAAAARYQIPESWIRAVMHQESGGHEYASDGSLITSSSGAMGLMQVMPSTYEMLRQRYGLNDDPYDPHDNIFAGSAYIKELYNTYGSPGFLAAYNAGPNRLANYLAGGSPLPAETVNYVARITPNLGTEVAMSGPLAVYGGGQMASRSDQAYAGGGMVASDAYVQPAVDDDPSDRAYDGGGLVTPGAPTGVLTPPAGAPVVIASAALGSRQAAYAAPSPPRYVEATVTSIPAGGYAAPRSAAAPAAYIGGWAIQVGAYPNPATSQAAISTALARANDLLASAQPAIIPVQRAGTLYRARLIGLSADRAAAACSRLASGGMDCFTVPPGS